MNTFEFILSLQCRMVITFIALLLYGVISPESNPHDVLAPALDPLLHQIKSAIIPALCTYWGISMLINKIIYK